MKKGNSAFAERIKKLREEKGESQLTLAKLVGYKKQAVSHWENSGKVPRSHILAILAKHYQTTSDYLLGFDGKERIESPEEIPTHNQIIISPEEKRLVLCYRQMENHQKDMIRKVAETIVPLEETADKNK